MATKKSSATPLVSAAVRVLAVLEHLSRQRAIGLEDISKEIKLAKPTVYRFLLTLQELGYVRRVDGERGRYFTGLRLRTAKRNTIWVNA